MAAGKLTARQLAALRAVCEPTTRESALWWSRFSNGRQRAGARKTLDSLRTLGLVMYTVEGWRPTRAGRRACGLDV